MALIRPGPLGQGALAPEATKGGGGRPDSVGGAGSAVGGCGLSGRRCGFSRYLPVLRIWRYPKRTNP